jgi:hypothetical protein
LGLVKVAAEHLSQETLDQLAQGKSIAHGDPERVRT